MCTAGQCSDEGSCVALTGVSGEGGGTREEEAENPDFTFRRTLKGNVRWLDVAGDGVGGAHAGAQVRGPRRARACNRAFQGSQTAPGTACRCAVTAATTTRRGPGAETRGRTMTEHAGDTIVLPVYCRGC